MYDDITSRVHFTIRNEERPPVQGPLPSPQDQQLIRDVTGRPGWGPERVSAHLRRAHDRPDISPDTVRLVLARRNA
jgi:hypothetical protein